MVDDALADPRVTAADLAAYEQTQIRAVICVPLHKAGRFVAAMAVHQRTPRHWLPEEVDLVRTTTQRCWESIARALSGGCRRASVGCAARCTRRSRRATAPSACSR